MPRLLPWWCCLGHVSQLLLPSFLNRRGNATQPPAPVTQETLNGLLKTELEFQGFVSQTTPRA